MHRVPSFAEAKRRIYMTATLADDSVLVTHFNADPKSISTSIIAKAADDLGDRMILTPLETHPGTRADQIQAFLRNQAERHNVVVIVPSRRRAEAWQTVADLTLDSSTIHAGVQALQAGHVGLVVLINKYDGVDLPGNACRILPFGPCTSTAPDWTATFTPVGTAITFLPIRDIVSYLLPATSFPLPA